MQKERKNLMYTRIGPTSCLQIAAISSIFYSAVDLFGPVIIKDMIKKRTCGKGYGVIFNCLATRAVYIDLTDGYDTDSFILVLRRFISIRGHPVKIRLDPGSQLVAAGKEIKLIMQDWNWDKIHTFSCREGIE